MIHVHAAVDDVDLVTSAPLEQRGVCQVIGGGDAATPIDIHVAIDDVYQDQRPLGVVVRLEENLGEVVGGGHVPALVDVDPPVDNVHLVVAAKVRHKQGVVQVIGGINRAALVHVHIAVDDVDLMANTSGEQRDVGQVVGRGDVAAPVDVHAAI